MPLMKAKLENLGQSIEGKILQDNLYRSLYATDAMCTENCHWGFVIQKLKRILRA